MSKAAKQEVVNPTQEETPVVAGTAPTNEGVERESREVFKRETLANGVEMVVF